MKVWTDYQDPAGIKFTVGVSYTIHGPPIADCGSLALSNNCEQTVQCSSNFEGGGSGAVGYEIWNSMVIIHEARVKWKAWVVGDPYVAFANHLI